MTGQPALLGSMLLLLFVAACERSKPTPHEPAPGASTTKSRGPLPKPRAPTLGDAEFRRLSETLSEPDRGFISDNYVSNETSYLQVVPFLQRRPAKSSGVYLGVGPEQNFTYLAAARPGLAFIVDIRRGNLLLHLLYKAMFELAESRSHFLCLLLARPYQRDSAPGARATIQEVIEHATLAPSSPRQFEKNHAQLLHHLASVRGLSFDAADRAELRRAHQAFFKGQLETRFSLKKNSTRKYATLGQLLSAVDPDGHTSGFLASERAFRFVVALQKRNGVVPVVGDFAGTHALKAIAGEIKRRQLSVAGFYVSNVEQYLLGDTGTWQRWMDNLAALPTDEQSWLARAYLDQGQAHPQQLPGHRSTSVLQPLEWVRSEQRRAQHKSLLYLSRAHVLTERSGVARRAQNR